MTDVEHAREQFLAVSRTTVAPMVVNPMPLVESGMSIADICMNGSVNAEHGVLLDTGANEILRQSLKKPPRSCPLPLTLANGSAIDARRTRDGEVVIIGESGGDIICGVNRLIQVGCVFQWSKVGPKLQLPPELDEEWVDLTESNGLPYVDKHVFNQLRPLMTKSWKASHRCNRAVSGMSTEPTPNLHLRLEVMMQVTATEETSSGGDDVTWGEALASDVLARGVERISFEDLLGTFQQSKLHPLRSKVSPDVGSGIKAKQPIRAWTFGAYSYTFNKGITAGTKMRPQLVRLLNKFLAKLAPEARWTSLILNDGITYQPHRDHNNEHGSMNLVVCLDDDQNGDGGGIWIENPDGVELRQISPGKVLQGTIHDIRRRLLTFDPGLWHGTEPWTGSRVSLTAFTAGGWQTLEDSELQILRNLDFPLPEGNINRSSSPKLLNQALNPLQSSSSGCWHEPWSSGYWGIS